MTMYRLCLLGPALRMRAVRCYSADSDKEALSIARGIFEDDPWMGAFELWLGPRRIAAVTASVLLAACNFVKMLLRCDFTVLSST